MTDATNNKPDKRPLLFMGNRWTNTIYTGYGLIKQRILLQILEADKVKKAIGQVMNGRRVEEFNFRDGEHVDIPVDLSKISKYNNYHQVRKALEQMCKDPISIYEDPTFKKPLYVEAPLIHAFEHKPGNKKVVIWIKSEIAKKLIYVDYERQPKPYPPSHAKAGERRDPYAYQFTGFDAFTLRNTDRTCKYVWPLYTMICSYKERGGFEISVEDLRRRLQLDETYKGWHEVNRRILKHVQQLFNIAGGYSFNFKTEKTGRDVTKVIFKVFKNTKFDPNHIWLKITRALTEELPYYMRFTELQQEKLNYLLDEKKYDLHAVYNKLQKVHKYLEGLKAKGRRDVAKISFDYLIKSLHEQFPPG